MNNRICLNEYLLNFRTVSEKRQLFYAVFEEMHRYHNNGEYISKLSFRTIQVNFTNPSDIHFTEFKKIGKLSIQDVLSFKFQNIRDLVQLMMSSFLEYDSSVPIICMEVLEEKIDEMKKFFHPTDYLYFEKIIKEQEFLYYDDYIRNLGCEKFTMLQERRKISEGEQAFTSYLLLTINLVIVVMVFGCIFLYLS